MRHPELPIISFLCILLLLISLPSHIRTGSIATIALIAWLGIMSLIRGVNALIWANNFDIKVPIWCDISTKITVGFTFAVPAAALCILRHLESIASTRTALTTQEDKRRRQKFEAFMCFGFPLLFMALHYVVQGHRFDLFEDFGCYPTVYFSVASILLMYVPPLILSQISFVYAGLTLRHFLRHRINFAVHLQESRSIMSAGRYFRLMSMAVVEMVWDTGVNIYIIWFNTLTGLRPWISWENVHSNFSRVGVFPEFLNPPGFAAQLIWQWWIVPISCVLFFIFFGFGEEAMADYRGAIVWLRRCILRQSSNHPSLYTNSSILPVSRSRVPGIDIIHQITVDETPRRQSNIWTIYESNRQKPHDVVHSYSTASLASDDQPKQPDILLPQYIQSISHVCDSEEPPSPEKSSLDPEAFAQIPATPPHQVFSRPVSDPTEFQQAVSADLQITGSQAYLPKVETTIES